MARRAAGAAFVATGALVGVALAQVLRSGSDAGNSSAAGYLPLAYAAAAVLLVTFVLAAFVRRVDISLRGGFPWLVGTVSFAVSLVPWWLLAAGASDLGASIYRGLRVPQGIIQFWDLTLVMKSIDCASWGFDVFAQNNGCLQDPAIYGPGMLWLRYVPFDVFSERHVAALGVASILVSSLLLVWLARSSAGLGRLVLLVAAVGGPWLLLLERGNIDAVVMWAAAAAVLLVRRWDRLWAWSLAAAIIWLVGTWKYYPFAMGFMLIPALRIRRGWTVVAGYAAAAAGFMLLTWDNFLFSSESNSNMIDYGDFVVLGRVPVVSRMLGTVVGASGLQAGDWLVYALVLTAVVWGVAVGLGSARSLVHPAMLAVAGAAPVLASVLVAGFGWGYKSAFLLLAVPLVSAFTQSRRGVLVSSAVAVLGLVGISAIVDWNTVLATLSVLVAAGFALGLGGILLLRAARPFGSLTPVGSAAPTTG